MNQFKRFIGVDYSGAGCPDTLLGLTFQLDKRMGEGQYEVNLHDSPILLYAFQRFAATCRANPTDRGYFSGVEPQYELLEKEIASTLPAYQRAVTGWDAQSQIHIRRIRVSNNLREFFDRIGAFSKIKAGQFDSAEVARDFEREIGRNRCELLILT